MEAVGQIQFFVNGLPSPGGSKKHFVLRRKDGSLVTRPDGSPIVNVTDMGGQKTKNWRANVAFFAREAYDGAPLLGPLLVRLEFIMPRPGSHFGSGKNAAQLKPSAPKYHTVMPDASKLTRSTEDALTGILWRDDAQVFPWPTKVYGDRPGCLITVWKLSNENESQGAADVDAPLFEELLAGVSNGTSNR